MKPKKLTTVLRYIFLSLMAVFAAFPLVQVLFNSFRDDSEVKVMPIGLPKKWVFYNYGETWATGEYGSAFLNSLKIAVIVIAAVLVLVGLSGYALSKLQFKGRGFMNAYYFVAISLPGFLYIVPDFFVMNKMGLTRGHSGIILLYIAMNIPFNVILLRTFLMGIPHELEEAGKIDGCSELSVLLYITLPVAKSIFLTIALLVFVNVWNEFLWANTFLMDDAMKTVATRYVRFVGKYSSNMARIYTASVFTIAPVVVLYLAFNRRFIEGMTSGSVKG